MKAKLIDLSNGAKYRVNDVREVVTITVSWGTQMVHYNNGIVAGSLPISDFVHGVWHDSIEYVEPVETKSIVNTDKTRALFVPGDGVYFSTNRKIQQVEAYDTHMGVKFKGTFGWVSPSHCCLATHENYEHLSAAFPMLGYERPVGDKNDLASINSYGPDVSFVSVDEAADLEAAECVEKTQAESPQATDILQEAKQTIAQRGVMYDSTGQKQERSMPKVVAMFNAMTGHELTVGQGWKFMCLLKLARSEQGEFNIDSFIDLAAYAALAGEEEWTKNNS